MKYLFLISIVIICFAAIVYAQDSKISPQPDLNGSWTLTKTEMNKAPFGIGTDMNSQKCQFDLVIEQKGPEIHLRRLSSCPDPKSPGQLTVSEYSYFYYTDGRGESNNSVMEKIVASVTRWKESIILIEQFKKLPKPDSKHRTKAFRTVEFELSSDGKKLVERISDSGKGSFSSLPVSATRIYSKVK